MALYINGNKASGGTDIVHLTQAQYDALPSSKNYDDKVYMITDVNGDGSQFQPVIYSEDEQVVGTWIDGSTLYQKTINSNLTLTNSWQNYFDLTGIDKVIDVNKIIVERDGEQISYVFSNNALTSWLIRDGYIKFEVQGNLLSETWILKSITIQYTKTQGGA